MEKNPDQLKNLPTLPGVYQFKNKEDKIKTSDDLIKLKGLS